MMLCAAIAGFATVVHTGSTAMGFLAGMGAGALLAAVFGVLVIWLNTNQYATGWRCRCSARASRPSWAWATCRPACRAAQVRRAWLSDLPVVGNALFRLHPWSMAP